MPGDRPNVLIVQPDQWRGQALGCVGNDQVQTPRIDAFAPEGALFERTYSPQPVCSPARGSIQTGQYPHEHGVFANTYLDLPLPDDATTIAELLGDAGYETGYVGKWHLAGSTATPSDVPPDERFGYEFWSGFDRDQHQHLRGHPIFASPSDPHWIGERQPDVQTDVALDFLAQDREAPAFCYVGWGPPHTPYRAPEAYEALYDPDEIELRPNVPDEDAEQARESLASYYAMCTWLDDQFGRLLDGLDEMGLTDDTLVVFTADHGDFVGSHGRPYGKHAVHEEASRVPLAVRYPGEIEGGRRPDAFVNLVDLLPTLLSICGVDVPEDVHGRDLSGLWLDGDGPAPDHTYIQGREGDQRWRAVRTERYVYAVNEDLGTRHLFDLAEDPYQLDDLADEAEPDAPVADLRERLVDDAVAYDDRALKAAARFDFETDERVFAFDRGEVRR